MIFSSFHKAICFFSFLYLFLSPSAILANEPEHLKNARELVQAVGKDNNQYATSPSYLGWFWEEGMRTVHLRTVCSTFITLLLHETYKIDQQMIRAWIGSGSPTAEQWHDAINQENGFQRIDDFRDIKVGDFIAINYPTDRASTGHIVIVNSLPRARIATGPVVPGTHQFELSVIDSSAFPHGPEDTRMLPNQVRGSGAGRGTMRFYLSDSHRLQGHTWSIFRSSEYRSNVDYPIVIGRLLLPNIN